MWKSVLGDNKTFTMPRKGDRVRVEQHVVCVPAGLAGCQMKTGADKVDEAEGVMLDVQGVFPVGTTPETMRSTRPVAIILTLRRDDDSQTNVFLRVESLSKLCVQAPDPEPATTEGP